MRALVIEFQEKRIFPPWMWTVLLSIFGAIAVIQSVHAFRLWEALSTARHKQQTLVTEYERLQQTIQKNQVTRPLEPSYFKDAESIQRWAEFPLNNVLTAIESIETPDLTVTSLEVSATDRTARVELAVKDSNVVTEVIQQLNQGEPKPRWLLINGANLSASGPDGKVSLISNW